MSLRRSKSRLDRPDEDDIPALTKPLGLQRARRKVEALCAELKNQIGLRREVASHAVRA
jgi:hypothetical protein